MTHALILDESGHATIEFVVPEAGIVSERIYPLCGNAVQTEVRSTGTADDETVVSTGEVRVRPDSYVQRTVIERLDSLEA